MIRKFLLALAAFAVAANPVLAADRKPLVVVSGQTKQLPSGDALTVNDDAYDATSWNGSTAVPTKNAVRDKIESLGVTPITAKDEGSNLTTTMTSIDFVGAGVTATNVGGAVSVNITGSGGAVTGSLIGVQIITATGAGTYTPTAGTNSIIIEMVGAGGGGGGVSSPTGSNVAIGRGGGGGAYLRKRLTSAFSGASISVGAKGTGGTAGNNAGTAGGDTTFTATGGGGTVYTAGGGGAGGGSASLGLAPQINGGVLGGTATNGDLNIPGNQCIRGMALSSSMGQVSVGGIAAVLGGGSAPQIVSATNSSTTGSSAGGKGNGGNGAIAVGTGVAAAGGDGADGILIIYEYA